MTREEIHAEQEKLLAGLDQWLAWLRNMAPQLDSSMDRIAFLGGYQKARMAFETCSNSSASVDL